VLESEPVISSQSPEQVLPVQRPPQTLMTKACQDPISSPGDLPPVLTKAFTGTDLQVETDLISMFQSQVASASVQGLTQTVMSEDPISMQQPVPVSPSTELQVGSDLIAVVQSQASTAPPAVLTKACRDLQRQISSLTRLQSASSSRTSCAITTIHTTFDKLRTA